LNQLRQSYPPRARWWREGALLRRFVSDFIYGELTLMRRGRVGLPPPPWTDRMQLEADLGVDSLERYALATAMSGCLHLYESGAGQALLQCVTLAQWTACAGEGLDLYHAEISFKTSGSSGEPKSCEHTLDMLWEEACFFAAQLPQARRIVCAVPAHHIYGFLFSVLLPLAFAAVSSEAHALRPIALADARGLLPAALAAQAQSGDVIVGYPELWSAVAGQSPVWPAEVMGVTSTAPCPRDVALRLDASGVRLAEIYGSSESAGVGWRTDARQPYELLPHWRRIGSGDTLERQASDGRTHRCACQDHMEWQGERHFVPMGRRDAAVQVGGINVFPAQVAALLKRHPGVREAQVRLMRPDEGQRLKAFVVAADAAVGDGLPDQLVSWVRERLPAAARPVSFTVGATLPVNRQGKPADWIIDGGSAEES
jgi:4-coumarate--CoA ligase (photoactive yellow protein activation family)